ncbi:hypothetical protein SO802_024497 [Lithocarpus litseifolius]|uniref:Uncharacterized protein n=1 Tax=Lithocarpus litseifolius TaxID=425828 RepID=A0AAW2C994_9ROSI
MHLKGVYYCVMNDVNYRRLVLACLVNGVYILGSNRQQNRDEIEALATPWWESFHFQLHDKLVDNNDHSIFGAIYEYKYPNPAPSFPQYVIAFRGTLLKKETALRDCKLNFKCLFNKLHKSSRFQLATDRVLDTMSGGARVWEAEAERWRRRAGQHVKAADEEGISDLIYAIPISDPTGEVEVMTDLQSDWR